MVCSIQGADDATLGSHELGEGSVDDAFAGIGELHEYTAAVLGMVVPGDESTLGEPVHAIRHRS
jgi:hypothetical protein